MSTRVSTCRSPLGRRFGATNRGFTLVEVLVAFVVLAIGLSSLAVGVTAALRSDAKVHNKRVIDQIAESRLEAIGWSVPPASGRREGRIGRYRWREKVTPVQLRKAGAQDRAAPLDAVLVPSWVEIVVHDEAGLETKLAVLKLVPGTAR